MVGEAIYRVFTSHIILIWNKLGLTFFHADLTRALFVIIGGEKRGITRSLLNQADLILNVPYRRAFKPALGATSAAAVLAFEVLRQRGYEEVSRME